MKYIALVATQGAQPQEALDYMHREWPAYAKALEQRGGWRLGRELTHPPAPVTVRVRDGQALTTDGPFVETKEYVAGFDLFEAVDMADAIQIESRSPVARFCPFEIRPFDGLVVGAGSAAFADHDDSAGVPHLLTVWSGAEQTALADDQTAFADCDAWRRRMEAEGVFVLGGPLSTRETTTTLRFADWEVRAAPGPLLDIEASIAAIDVIWAADREQAIGFAAGHPLAREYAIQVDQFHIG